MRRELQPAVTPADLDVRVVILDVRHVCDRIRETHRAVEVLELELAPQDRGLGGQHPPGGQLGQQLLGCATLEGSGAALAGDAAFGVQLRHATSLLRGNRRATYCSTIS